MKHGNKKTTPWCTCLGSRVCSQYAKKFKDGTRVKFINNRHSNTEIARNPGSNCEGHYGDLFSTNRHLTPGVNAVNTELNCKFNEKTSLKHL